MTLGNIGLLTAFLAGLISFLSPCVLPLVPGYVSYVSGNTLGNATVASTRRWVVILLGAWFVLGFSSVFIALGATATALSRLLLLYRYEANIVGGLIIIVFGAFTTGLIRLPLLQQDMRYHGRISGGRPLGAFALGVAFGFGWTPCIGPVLGAILTLSAVSATATSGVTLLAIYSLGLGVPFLLSAAFTDVLMRRLKSAGRLGRSLQVGAGVVMMLMGVAMITGTMSNLAFWLLETFPILSKIG